MAQLVGKAELTRSLAPCHVNLLKLSKWQLAGLLSDPPFVFIWGY